jgi:hypothetical protein
MRVGIYARSRTDSVTYIHASVMRRDVPLNIPKKEAGAMLVGSYVESTGSARLCPDCAHWGTVPTAKHAFRTVWTQI